MSMDYGAMHMPGYVEMPDYAVANVFERGGALNGFNDSLRAPMYNHDGVLRPSILGGLEGTETVHATVTIDSYEQSLVVGFELGPGISEFVGRPVIGYDGHDVVGTYGDSDGVESGYVGFQAVVHADGTAALIGLRSEGGNRLLTGVEYPETEGFVKACLSAAKYHLSKKNRRLNNSTTS